MFELDGVPEDLAREALALAAMKLPVKTKFVTRVGRKKIRRQDEAIMKAEDLKTKTEDELKKLLA